MESGAWCCRPCVVPLQPGLWALPSPRTRCKACSDKVASRSWPSQWPCDAWSLYEQQHRGATRTAMDRADSSALHTHLLQTRQD